MQLSKAMQTFLAGNAFLFALLDDVNRFKRADFSITNGKCVDKRI